MQNHIIFSLDDAKFMTDYFFRKNVLKIEWINAEIRILF